MSNSEQQRANLHAQGAALLRWGFPFVILVVTLGSQILLPRILQLRLSEGEYTSYVAVSATIAYLTLADAGMVVALQREMSFAHGAGDRAAFAAESMRARRVFLLIGIVCCAIATATVWSTFEASERAWGGASTGAFRISVIATLAASAYHVSIGGYHSIVQLSTGRLIAGQATGVLSMFIPVLALLTALVATRDLATSLFVNAGATVLVCVWRHFDARRIIRAETAGAVLVRPRSRLSTLLLSGLAIRAAEVLPISAYPHALSLRAPQLVPAAVPARTYTNACRLLPQQFSNLLFSHITRRFAGDSAERLRGEREYSTSATCLCAVHLVSIGVLGIIAVPVFELWLPSHAATVSSFLPGLLVEQALLSASTSSTLLLAAHGRLTLLGLARLSGGLMGLLVFVLLLPVVPYAAFGIGFACSALPLYVVGYLFETQLKTDRNRGVARYLTALISAVACVGYASRPITSCIIVLACACVHIPAAILGLRDMFRELRSMRH